MKKIYKTLLFVALTASAMGQARLVLNSNPYIVLNGGTSGSPIHIVLDNSATTAITWTGTAQDNGGIISEGQHNKMKWNVGTATGTYSVPFTAAAAGPAIPVNLTIGGGTPGVGAGNIKFSTYGSASDDNSGYMPTGGSVTVTNMASSSASAQPSNANNSYRVMDRFWIIDANGYNASAKPAGNMTFYFKDAEQTQGNGTTYISETNLRAQRWDDTNDDWDGYALTGTSNVGAGNFDGNVSGITFTASDFEAAWVLVDLRAALPIELTQFKGDCENGQRNIRWTTATETNNDFFSIEKSVDGVTFTEIAIIDSKADNGNSTSTLNYSYVDLNNVLGNYYYRLKQTDYDTKYTYSSIIFNKCDDGASQSSSADVYPNPSNGLINVLLTGYENESIQINIMNGMGQVVAERKVQGGSTTQKETFSLAELAKGIYYVKIVTEKETLTKKVINQH